MVLFFTHIPFVVNHTINATPPERLQQHPLLFQRTAPIARSLCEGWTRHDLHILVTAPFYWDLKSRAACAQSFAPWQQATIEIILAISLTIACSRYIYNGAILHAHPVRGESHNERNTTGKVETIPVFAKLDSSRSVARSRALGALSLFWEGFTVKYNQLENHFIGETRELKFGSIAFEFGRLNPPVSSSVETVSQLPFIICGIVIFSSHQQSNVQTCEMVLSALLKFYLGWLRQMYCRAICFEAQNESTMQLWDRFSR